MVPRYSNDPIKAPAATFVECRDSLGICSKQYANFAQQGGTGWKGRWRHVHADSADAPDEFLFPDSIAWPESASADDSGSLRIAGNTFLESSISRPIRMVRDGAYYLSFRVQKQKKSIHRHRTAGPF